MSERLSAPDHIDVSNPDYEHLAHLLLRYLENSPSAKDLSGLKDNRLVSTIIWWAKEANQANPQTVISEIFGVDVWESGDWT